MKLLNLVGTLDPDQLLNETQVADLVCQSVRTLQKWRVTGAGPAFYKLGQSVRYKRADVLAWIEARRVKSTSATPSLSIGGGRQAGRDARACAGARRD